MAWLEIVTEARDFFELLSWGYRSSGQGLSRGEFRIECFQVSATYCLDEVQELDLWWKIRPFGGCACVGVFEWGGG